MNAMPESTVIAGWKTITMLLYREAGVEIIPESIVVDKRLPHEYPQHLRKQDEQIKCK